MLDTVVTVETPEGMLLELRPAGPAARFHAFLIDWLLRLMILYAAVVATTILGGVGTAFWLILLFALEWLYPVVCELMPSGATPGKRVMGLRVVMDNGLPVTPSAAIVRNILRAADFLPFMFGFAIVSMLVRADGKRLGDIAAGTIVVHDRPARSEAPVADAAPLQPALRLSREQQSAVVALAARAPRLTPQRLDELASLAAVVSGDTGHTGPEVTTRVLGVAQWLLGRRR
jgi:uncharacterized RDD family membrane protein YckC